MKVESQDVFLMRSHLKVQIRGLVDRIECEFKSESRMTKTAGAVIVFKSGVKKGLFIKGTLVVIV
jgi:hypothetical protein